MIDDTLREELIQSAARTMIGKKNGTKFRNFLRQPAVSAALARYLHAKARGMLWLACVERYGRPNSDGDKIGPKWLDEATGDDELEEDLAYYALEVALQEEVEKRVTAALAEARTQTKKTAIPRLRELTRHLAATVRRSVSEQQQADFTGTGDALEAAGLKSKARKKPAATN